MIINIDKRGIWCSDDKSAETKLNINHDEVNFNNDIGFCTGGSFNASPAAYTAGLTMGFGSSLYWVRTGVGPAPRRGDVVTFKIRFSGTRSVMGGGQFRGDEREAKEEYKNSLRKIKTELQHAINLIDNIGGRT